MGWCKGEPNKVFTEYRLNIQNVIGPHLQKDFKLHILQEGQWKPQWVFQVLRDLGAYKHCG